MTALSRRIIEPLRLPMRPLLPRFSVSQRSCSQPEIVDERMVILRNPCSNCTIDTRINTRRIIEKPELTVLTKPSKDNLFETLGSPNYLHQLVLVFLTHECGINS